MVYVVIVHSTPHREGRQVATVTIEDDRLVVRLSGWEAVFALKREINASLQNVVSVRAGSVPSLSPNGFRLPGAYIPKVIAAGSYWSKSGGWSFWSVRHPEKAVDIGLRDSRYRRIVVEVDDPYATVAQVEAALSTTA